MHAAWIVVVGAALGVDVGWQPRQEGGFEYIIQLEPQALEALRSGETLRSDLPPFLLHQVRSYRIYVGNQEVPRLGQPEQVQQSATSDPEPASRTPAEDAGNSDVPRERRAPRNDPRYPLGTSLEERTVRPPAGDVEDNAATPPSLPPRTFQSDDSSAAVTTYASGYLEAADHRGDDQASAGSNAAHDGNPLPAASSRWFPLTTSLLLLFVSMGGNAYLGMQWWSTRRRCQDLLRRNRLPRSAAHTELASQDDPEDEDEDQEVRAINDEEADPRT